MTSLEFYTLLKSSERGKEYLDLIERSKNRNLQKEKGYEIHHIQPRGLGGTNAEDNLVKLSVFEHCLAHVLLAKIYTSPVTLKPISKMSYKQFKDLSDLDRVTLEEVWEWSTLREKALHCTHTAEHSKHISEAKKGKPSWRRGMKTSEETKKKLSESNRGKPHLSARGRVVSEETRKKISKALKGKPGTRYWTGKHRSEKDRQTISDTLKGRTVLVNSEGKHVMPTNDRLQEYLDQGWQKGRIFKAG